MQYATGEFATAALAKSGSSTNVAATTLAADLSAWAYLGTSAVILVLFPTGRPASRPWWAVVWVIAAGVVCGAITDVFMPSRYSEWSGINNRFGFTGLPPALAWLEGGLVLFPIGLLGAIVSLLARFVGAREVERQQLKVFLYGVAIAVAVFVLPLLLPPPAARSFADSKVGPALQWGVPPAVIAVTVGVAIMRHRLYDIDRIISRTLVYTGVSAVLGLGYAAVTLTAGQLFGGVGADPPAWAIAGSTLAAAAVFHPVRRVVQQRVDRRFNRRRYDTVRTIEAFSLHLRDEIDLSALDMELLAVVNQTMQPTAALLFRPSAADGHWRNDPQTG